jgi:hypothetical protein
MHNPTKFLSRLSEKGKLTLELRRAPTRHEGPRAGAIVGYNTVHYHLHLDIPHFVGFVNLYTVDISYKLGIPTARSSGVMSSTKETSPAWKIRGSGDVLVEGARSSNCWVRWCDCKNVTVLYYTV